MEKRILQRRCRFPLPSFFSLVVLSLVFPAHALKAQFLTLPVNLTYLSQRADVIVQGNVIDVRRENHPDFSNIPTVKVTLEVEDMLRGPSGRTYTFREVLIGIKARNAKQVYKTGQKLMLFLPSPSRYGLSSPVGIEQGRFHITHPPGGKETIANEIGNAGLFKDVENTAFMAGIRLSAKHMRLATTKKGPVPLDDFAALVKTLTALPRIR
ncbi:MAG: hypothetical protein JXR49_16970 [Acidobacteria bacterium]|nr:hypothetical protein [Acidobacteriota bacterium]